MESRVAVPWAGVCSSHGGSGRVGKGLGGAHVCPGSRSLQLPLCPWLADSRCSGWFGGRAPVLGDEGRRRGTGAGGLARGLCRERHGPLTAGPGAAGRGQRDTGQSGKVACLSRWLTRAWGQRRFLGHPGARRCWGLLHRRPRPCSAPSCAVPLRAGCLPTCAHGRLPAFKGRNLCPTPHAFPLTRGAEGLQAPAP